MELVISLCVLLLDQVSKYLTDLYLVPLGSSHILIPGVLQLTSAHNRGAAWGMMQGGRIFFIVLTVVVCGLLLTYLLKRRKALPPVPRVILALILAGAIGNLIDRIVLGYVRDMIYFILIDFPIFNVADSALTIGCVLLCVNILFMKEGTFPELKEKKQGRDDTGNV